jgi:2-succinyl-5-enolpyruvyl-6-hydroxy-3-cyclohexene-1-carboxylate synthase
MSDLVLIGGLAASDCERVIQFALALNATVYAEPLSGLREHPALGPLRIANERLLARGGFTRVIRVGNVPTIRFWRDLDEALRHIDVLSYSRLPFAGLSRGTLHPFDDLPADVARGEHDDALHVDDYEKSVAFHAILDAEPQSELALLRALALSIPRGARIYLGNSLPIREWDLVAPRDDRGFTIEANRGANGIDGQLSTFFGQCDPACENVAIVGDLTAIYDLNAPWIVPQLDARFRIVIINNGGGRIFERVASLRKIDKTMIVNAHALDFDHWSRMWGIEERVTELRPDAEASRRVWERYDALWS